MEVLGFKKLIWINEAKLAQQSYIRYQLIKTISYVAIGVAALVTTVYVILKKVNNNPAPKITSLSLLDSNKVSTPDTTTLNALLKDNTFTINPLRDTFIKTSDGKIIEIPKEVFQEQENNSITNHDTLKTSPNHTNQKLYTLHFLTPSYKDTLQKWKEIVNEKSYSKLVKSIGANLNPKRYFKHSANNVTLLKNDSVNTKHSNDSIYTAVFGLNIEKIKSKLSPKDSTKMLYKLKGKIPFLKKSPQQAVLVFDVNNKTKNHLDTAVIIEVTDQLKEKNISTKINQK